MVSGSKVAPLVGAWIEIGYTTVSNPIAANVAPLVGAWIEINNPVHERIASIVAPLVGAWIEIFR